MTFANDARIYGKIFELHETMVNEWKAETSDPDFITQCVFQSIPTFFAQHSIKKGGNMLGLERLNENFVMLPFKIAVKSTDLEVLARKKLRSSGEQIQVYAASLDGLVDWQYLNYADSYQVCADSITALQLADRLLEPTWKLWRGECGQNSKCGQEVRSQWRLSDQSPRRIQRFKGKFELNDSMASMSKTLTAR